MVRVAIVSLLAGACAAAWCEDVPATTRKVLPSDTGWRTIVDVLSDGTTIHGIMTAIDPQGRIREIQVYQRGQREGIYLGYDTEARLRVSGRYRANVPVGLWITYDEAGKVEKAEDRGGAQP